MSFESPAPPTLKRPFCGPSSSTPFKRARIDPAAWSAPHFDFHPSSSYQFSTPSQPKSPYSNSGIPSIPQGPTKRKLWGGLPEEEENLEGPLKRFRLDSFSTDSAFHEPLKVVGGDRLNEPRDMRFVLVDGSQPVSSYPASQPRTTVPSSSPDDLSSLALTKIVPNFKSSLKEGPPSPKNIQWKFSSPLLPKLAPVYLKDRTVFYPSNLHQSDEFDESHALVPYDGPIIEEVSDSEEYDEDGLPIPVTSSSRASHTSSVSFASPFKPTSSTSHFGFPEAPLVESLDTIEESGEDTGKVDAMEID